MVDVGVIHRQVEFSGDQYPGPPGWCGLRTQPCLGFLARVKRSSGGGRAVLL